VKYCEIHEIHEFGKKVNFKEGLEKRRKKGKNREGEESAFS